MGSSFSREEILKEAPVSKNPDEYFDYSAGGPWFRCSPDAKMAPRCAKSGSASAEAVAPTTVQALLKEAAQKKGDKPVMKVERPCPPLDAEGKAPDALPEEEWTTWTYQQYYDDCVTAAKAFIKLGFQPFDTVNVWGFNAPEWMIAAVAAGFAGGKVGGLYPTDMPDTAAYKVVHSGGSIVVVEDIGKIAKLETALAARGDPKPPKVKAIIAYGFEPGADDKMAVKGCGDVPILGWKAMMEIGAKECNDEVDKRTAAILPDHCAALVYTSGTTGDPKAVMISHDSMTYETAAVCGILKEHHGVCAGAEQERALSYLPLSHVAGKMVDIACPIFAGAKTEAWSTMYFARPYDLKAGSLKDRLCVVRPTIFLGVPLVWEKIADKLRAIGAANSELKQSIATWAKDLGLAHSKNLLLGGDGSYPIGYSLANTIVLNNVKGALGLNECKYGFTGAAPIRVDTLEYFGALGLNINEVYGMSECVGAVTVSTDKAHQWGSCGWSIPGCEVKAFIVDPADPNKKTECPRAPAIDNTEEQYQGELCYRGRTIMMGYLANPDLGPEHVKEIEKKTADAIDSQGWLHSGDKGMITCEGMVKITGRYKELIIGEGGENIAPVPIEDHVKKCCDGINEVMMVGDKRKYNVALVTLKAVGANGEVPGTDNLDAGAKRVNPEVTTISGAMDCKIWIEQITAAITSANNNSKVCPNQAFKIQKFMILPTNFSEEENFLTPTKKLKRPIVEKAFKKQVDAMYASKETYVRYQP